ncbi:MAG: bis-aminopropyl spermidine synthase family protein [Nocardioides sp.]
MDDEALAVLRDVAAAVDLAEGEAGVLRVLRTLAGARAGSTREIAGASRLPTPLAAAVLGELRSAGLVTSLRPAGLSERGREVAASLALVPVPVPDPAELDPVARRLDELVESGPDADLRLDQSYATGATKVRRVLHMLERGALPTPHLLAVGDDDLVSVAVHLVAEQLGVALAARTTVVDVDPGVLEQIARGIGDRADLELVEHDLRTPLPERVTGVATVAMTDPPYTTEGAELFVTRALEGLRPGPGWDVFLHYGAKPPGPALELQRVLTRLGLVVREARPGFNEYHGAGVLGGRSDAYHLEVAQTERAAPAAYHGVLYTADLRTRPRRYTCADCGHEELVGADQRHGTVGDLKAAGCPQCGGTTFRPGRLAPTEPTPPPPDVLAAGPPPEVRRAEADDLPALVDYEIEIAKVSFGDEAILDRAVHERRLVKALERDPDGCLVAVDASGIVVGWLWMALNTNFLTESPYVNFRSLAVSPGPASTPAALALIERGRAHAHAHGVTEIVAKVNAANLPMRVVFRQADFEPQFLTMRLLDP